MSEIRYVTLDPTGNITCLVTAMPPDADEAAVTRRLMRECEQVAFLEAPAQPGARARIRLMGGEAEELTLKPHNEVTVLIFCTLAWNICGAHIMDFP